MLSVNVFIPYEEGCLKSTFRRTIVICITNQLALRYVRLPIVLQKLPISSQTKPKSEPTPPLQTMKNKILQLTLSLIALITLASCGTPPRGYGYNGYGRPERVSYGAQYGGDDYRRVEARQHCDVARGDNREAAPKHVVEEGNQGRMRQEFDENDKPVGKPFWVPVTHDVSSYNGKPVKTMKHTRMSHEKLMGLLKEFDEPAN